ncbi:hypothetical protein [Pleurocapsa sp. PCC 7319]|uniref:hypothetical protein n=1 Tax=Pleurocapsa sp. PCC 7319 TaxID=118161 RepID=UPI000345E1C2|nr:hypothetical protein [Pleurocapsa sp. PCC 7319]
MFVTFSEFGRSNINPKRIARELGCQFIIDNLSFPAVDITAYLDEIKLLESKTNRRFKKISTNNEFAKREFLIAPILLLLFDWIELEIETEYYVDINRLKGKLDYLITGKKELLIIEAKNDNFDAGANQIIPELVATAEQENQDLLYGSVSNGILWKFYQCDRAARPLKNRQKAPENSSFDIIITQDISFYTFPKNSEELFAVLLGLLS